MRELKFRAWDTIHKKMSNTFTLLDCINNNQIFVCPENFEFLRFTGLKDKNGKEIYEGDIVLWEDEKLPVIYLKTEDYPAFDIDPISQIDDNHLSYLKAIRKLEVIGNIYENAELLKATS